MGHVNILYYKYYSLLHCFYKTFPLTYSDPVSKLAARGRREGARGMGRERGAGRIIR